MGRGFCPTCGAAVYSWNAGIPGPVFLRASGLDDPDRYGPRTVVFAERAPAWSKIDAALPAFEAMPPAQVMAQLLS